MYYEKKDSEDLAIVGDYPPQTYSFIKGYDKDSPNSVYGLLEYIPEIPPFDFIPNLDGFKMAQKAKLTDFVSNGVSSAWSQIISPKAWEIISKFSLPPHHIYPMGLYKRNIKYDYLWLTILPIDSRNIIDYEKSTFYLTQGIMETEFIERIIIHSVEELVQKKKSLIEKYSYEYNIAGTEIVIKENTVIPFDIFQFIYAPVYTEFVSERYKNAVEENGLTGLEFIPANNLKFQI